MFNKLIDAEAKAYVEITKTVLPKSTSTKTLPTNFCTLIAFLWITMALLIAVSIYCYLTRYRAKVLSMGSVSRSERMCFYLSKVVIITLALFQYNHELTEAALKKWMKITSSLWLYTTRMSLTRLWLILTKTLES